MIVDFYNHKWRSYIFKALIIFYISEICYCFWFVKEYGASGITSYDFLREELFLLKVQAYCFGFCFFGIEFNKKNSKYHLLITTKISNQPSPKLTMRLPVEKMMKDTKEGNQSKTKNRIGSKHWRLERRKRIPGR